MQTSKNCLLDVNCWLAAAARRHRHHPEAKSWLEAAGSPLAFCRVTQMGFLRLVTNAKVMGADVLSPAEAWAAYQKFLADPRVVFAAEPFELENEWRQITGLPNFKPNSWTDSYLAAFARAGGYRVVTFDNGFENYSGLDVIILLPAAELGKIS